MKKLLGFLAVTIFTLGNVMDARALEIIMVRNYSRADLAVLIVKDIKQADLVIYDYRNWATDSAHFDKGSRLDYNIGINNFKTDYCWIDVSIAPYSPINNYINKNGDKSNIPWKIYFLQKGDDSSLADLKVFILSDWEMTQNKNKYVNVEVNLSKYCGWKNKKHFLYKIRVMSENDPNKLMNIDMSSRDSYYNDKFLNIIALHRKSEHLEEVQGNNPSSSAAQNNNGSEGQNRLPSDPDAHDLMFNSDCNCWENIYTSPRKQFIWDAPNHRYIRKP